MARCYLRTPNYIGAYLRNRNPEVHIPLGGEVCFPETSTLYYMLSGILVKSPDKELSGINCFSEKQFLALKEKLHGEYPEDVEVAKITGYDKTIKGTNEYICIVLPRETENRGLKKRTTASYKIQPAIIKSFVSEIKKLFWRDFIQYMEKDKEWALTHGCERTVIEGIERFMERYDIPNAEDGVMKKNLKRYYHRLMETTSFSPYDEIEHGHC